MLSIRTMHRATLNMLPATCAPSMTSTSNTFVGGGPHCNLHAWGALCRSATAECAGRLALCHTCGFEHRADLLRRTVHVSMSRMCVSTFCKSATTERACQLSGCVNRHQLPMQYIQNVGNDALHTLAWLTLSMRCKRAEADKTLSTKFV